MTLSNTPSKFATWFNLSNLKNSKEYSSVNYWVPWSKKIFRERGWVMMLYDNFPTSEFSKSRPKPKDIEASWMSLLLVNYWVLSPGVEPSHTSIQHGRVLQSLIQSIQIWPLSAILKYFIKNDSRGKLCANKPRLWCQLPPSTPLQIAWDDIGPN